MFQIKQSEATAARRRIPVLLVSISDGYTPSTGIVTPTINISKNGAAVASGAGTWTEIGNGQYYYEFTATEVDTLGWIAVNIEKITVTRDYNSVVQVQAYDPFDVLRLGLTALPSVASGSAGGILTSGTGTSQLNVSAGNVAGSVASVVGAVGSVTGNVGGSVASVTGAVGSVTAGVTVTTNNDKTGYSLSASQTFSTTGAVGSVTGAVASVTGAVGSVTGAVGSVTGNVGGNVTGSVGSVTGNVGGNVTGSVGSFTAVAIQSIWDRLTSNLTTVGSAGKLLVDNLNSPVGSVPGNVWSNATRTITGGTLTVSPPTALDIWSFATRTITGGSLTVAPLTASETAGAVWNAAVSAYTTNGTYGLMVLRSDAPVKAGDVTLASSGGTNRIDADVHAIQNDTAAVTSFKNMLTGVSGSTLTANITGNVSGSVGSVTTPTSIVNATWNEARTGHTTPGTFGYYLDAQVSAGGGGGGGSTSTLRMGPFLVVSDKTKQDLNVDILTGSSIPVVLQLVDVTGTAIPLSGATITVSIYNTSGTLVTSYPGTASYADGGYVTFTLDSVVTANPGTYYVTVTRTTGASDTSVYGGLRLYVRSN